MVKLALLHVSFKIAESINDIKRGLTILLFSLLYSKLISDFSESKMESIFKTLKKEGGGVMDAVQVSLK